MVQLQTLNASPAAHLQKMGWDWLLGKDTMPYLTSEVVVVRKKEAEAYWQAAEELYQMLVKAGQHVMDHQLWDQLGIPENLRELIGLSWEDDRNLHLYGRFDLSGGVEGQPIKFIEFNADTATCLPETAVVQWAQLKANGMDEKAQFNTLFETLTANFRRLRYLNQDLTPTLLLSAFPDTPEDEANITILGEAAKEAGFLVDYRPIDQVDFSAEEGIFIEEADGTYSRFDFWFKLIPWEYIAVDEPELTGILTDISRKRKAVILNPAYTLLFQSKGILKILWDLFPYHPLLLETIDTPFDHKKSVEKVLFGREGANIRIMDAAGQVISEAGGDYGDLPKVYQEYTPFMQDARGFCYQAGVFVAYEPCGLGFRKGGVIIDNTSQFAGHMIR